MAIDTHIKFDGVEGEATHADHKNEISVLNWNWGVINQASIANGGSARGRATPQEFVFTHLYDKASPNLAKKCTQGIHFKEVMLTARKSGEGQKDFLKVTMKEVYITGVHPAGSQGGDIVEQVQMSYGSVEFAYKPQDEKGGLGGEVKFAWDVKTTKVT